MILWGDVETTGLDPEQDAILEVAFVLTSDLLDEVSTFFAVVHYSDDLSSVDPYVVGMHTTNGLWDECRAASFSIELTDTMTTHWLRTNGVDVDDHLLLAGSSVQFDRAFMFRWMPETTKFLHYRNIDVSTLRTCSALWAPSMNPTQPAADHRALPDIQETLRLARHYKTYLFGGAR